MSDKSSIVRPLVIIGVLLALYFALVGRTKLLSDADTLWHIAAGRTVIESGFITHDGYSFTRVGEPWIANQWLAECLLAVADSLGGFDGVFVLVATVLTVTYLAVAGRWLARGIDPVLSLTFLALILSASAYTLNARPHIVSISLLAFVFALMRDVEDGRRRINQLLWLVPVFVLWSNLHGGVLGGLGSLGLIAGGWTLLWIVGRATPIARVQDAGVLWLVVAACGLALFATPYGIRSFEAWRAILSMSLPELIIEHAPLRPGSTEGMLAILLCVVYIAVFAATPRAWFRPTFWMPLVWYLLTCMRIRHVSLFAIVAGIALADMLPESRLAALLVRRHWLKPRDTDSKNLSWRVAAVVLILMAPLVAAAVWFKNVGALPIVGAGWVHPAERVWPTPLIEPLKEFAAAQSEVKPVFNDPILGGFLIYNFPQLRVFIDGRCELYGEPFLRDFVSAWRDPERVSTWQDLYGFRAALIESNSPLRSYFDNNREWKLVAQSPSACFYRMAADYQQPSPQNP